MNRKAQTYAVDGNARVTVFALNEEKVVQLSTAQL